MTVELTSVTLTCGGSNQNVGSPLISPTLICEDDVHCEMDAIENMSAVSTYDRGALSYGDRREGQSEGSGSDTHPEQLGRAQEGW